MKHQGYVTRALKAKDPRYARILGKLGYNTTALAAEEVEDLDIDKLRDAYQAVSGKKPFMGWDAVTLMAKIKEKRAEG